MFSTVDVALLEMHLKKCNRRPSASSPPYYKSNCNVPPEWLIPDDTPGELPSFQETMLFLENQVLEFPQEFSGPVPTPEASIGDGTRMRLQNVLLYQTPTPLS